MKKPFKIKESDDFDFVVEFNGQEITIDQLIKIANIMAYKLSKYGYKIACKHD